MKVSWKKFTLIELIAVIVILAIISVVAIPKYLDLKESAEISAADGILGTLYSAVHLSYANYQLHGVALPTKIKEGYLTVKDVEGWSGTGLVITNGPYEISVNNETLPPQISKNW